MVRNAGTTDGMLEEAATLVEAATACPNEANAAALASWRRLSQDHENAVRVAEQFYQHAPQLSTTALTRTQRLSLTAQLWSDRLGARGLATAAATLVIIGLSVIATFRPNPTAAPVTATISSSDPVKRHATGHRQQQTLALQDGSTLWLDWSTEIALRFSENRREVRLHRGRIAMAVTTDQDRPFIVTAGQSQTRVTGTEFSVSYRDERAEVNVLEGSVEVAGLDQAVVGLEAAESVSVSDGQLGSVITRSLEEIGTWRDGMLVFRDRPLVEALATLSAYTSFTVDTSKLRHSNRIVSGTFFIDRADDATLSIITANRLSFDLGPGNALLVKETPPTRP